MKPAEFIPKLFEFSGYTLGFVEKIKTMGYA